jgi:nucleotide-binding universal stress UspA family protein
MRSIIVGYDESPAAERALERAAELAQALAASLLVVSVVRSSPLAEAVPALAQADVPLGPAPAVPSGPSLGAPALPVPSPEDVRAEPRDLAEHRLERARMALRSRNVEAELLAAVGDPAERLLALADERSADLIVVGSREHGFLDRLLGRHVDEAVAAHGGCDVLLVH